MQYAAAYNCKDVSNQCFPAEGNDDLHFAFIVSHERAAVGLDDRREFRGRKAAVADPAWELVVPHAVVTFVTLRSVFRNNF